MPNQCKGANKCGLVSKLAAGMHANLNFCTPLPELLVARVVSYNVPMANNMHAEKTIIVFGFVGILRVTPSWTRAQLGEKGEEWWVCAPP